MSVPPMAFDALFLGVFVWTGVFSLLGAKAVWSMRRSSALGVADGGPEVRWSRFLSDGRTLVALAPRLALLTFAVSLCLRVVLFTDRRMLDLPPLAVVAIALAMLTAVVVAATAAYGGGFFLGSRTSGSVGSGRRRA